MQFTRKDWSDFSAKALHHVMTIGGQVAAAAPIILVTIILSHTVGLDGAGQFVVAAGVSAIVFATAFLGFIYFISIDRLQDFDSMDFMWTRMIATAVAVVAVSIVSAILGVPFIFIALVNLLRIADSAVDLSWGLDLLRLEPKRTMRRYVSLNVIKLVLLVIFAIPVAVIGRDVAISSLIIGAAIAVLCCWAWVIRLSRPGCPLRSVRQQFIRSAKLARRAIWFTIGGSTSAAANSAARLALNASYTGTAVGVAGVSLAFSTIFSMAFMSSWLRWFPKLSQVDLQSRRYTGLVFESLLMMLLFLAFNLAVAPWIVGFLFGFDGAADRALSQEVLIASTLCGFAMNMANLFKLTRAVWLESVAYLSGIALGAIWIYLSPRGGVPGFLLAESFAILAVVIFGLRYSGTPSADQGRKKAIFLRLAARPVPRVTRMMRVADECGFEVSFIGALREKGLAPRDTWEGFPVERLGSHFPLLNGRKPWLYVRSVVLCNLSFFSALLEKKPALVHASDIETMPAALMYRLLKGGRLVYNIHDNLAQRYSLLPVINRVLNATEGLAVLFADRTLVPENFRREALPSWSRGKVDVIRNLPPDHGASPPNVGDGKKIRIFYGGWLDPQRGLDALLSLALEPDVELRIAGEGSSDLVERIRSQPSVTYLGFLNSSEIIKETINCHFIPVLYDPVRTINRYAASNKLAEALSVGRPIIINSELEVAKDLGSASCVVNVRYSDAGNCAPILRTLLTNESAYVSACSEARQLYSRHFNWEEMKARSRRALVG